MSSVAASKSEKNASTESAEPIKQAIIIIEHKIRNLEKRKRKIESYREEQKNGKELNADQLNAVAKFDEVQLTLEFARDLCKQFNGIVLDAVKQQKKQARKEAQERTQQEIAKVRDILLVQDVLYNLGAGESVRDDFIEGRNGAVMVSEDELNCLIEMSLAILPKRHKGDGLPTFADQIQASAEHLIALTGGKSKDVVGTTYSKLKELILSVNACGYFDEHVEEESIESAEEIVPLKIASENSISSQQESAENPKVVIVKSQTIIPQDSPFNRSPLQANISTQSVIHQINPSTVLSSSVIPTTQPPPSSAVPTPGAPLIVQPSHMHHIPQPVHTVENTFFSSASPPFVQPALSQSRPLNEVIRSVSGHFNFLQDSELDSPDLSSILSGAQGHSTPHVISTPTSANSTAVHPIPSQTFTNQNFVNVTGVTSPNIQHKVVFPSPEISHHIPGFATAASNASQISLPSNHQVPTVNQRPISIQQISAITQQASPNATLAQHRVPVPQVVNYVAAAAAIASQTFAQVHQLPQALPLKSQPLQLSQQPQQIQLPQTIQHTLQPQPSQLAQHPLPQQMHSLQQPTQPPQQLQPLQQLQGSPQPQPTQQPLQNTVQQQIHQRLPNVQSLPVLSQPVSPQVPVQSVPVQPSSSQTVLVHTTSAQALPVQTQPLPAGFPSQKSAPDPPVETEKIAEPAPTPPLDDKIDDWGSCDISQGDWSQQTELNTGDWSQQVAAEEWGECTTTTINGFPTEEHVRSSSNNGRGRGPRGGRGSNGYSGRGRRNYQNGRGGGYGYRSDFKNNFNQNSGDQRDNFNGGYKRGGRGRGSNARGSERGGGNSRGGGERGGSRPGVGRVGSNNNSTGNRSGNFPRGGNNKQP